MRRGTWLLAVICAAVPPASAGAATFAVNSTKDAVDASAGDGRCATADNVCTLRAAVMEADATSGENTITVPSGKYLMTIAPTSAGSISDVDASQGDLDIKGTVTIMGAGAKTTVVDGGRLDRIFFVDSGAKAVLSDMRITHADSTGGGTSQEIDLGGGVLNNGDVTLDRVALVDNLADGGGGMFSIPGTHPIIRDSLISNNRAYSGGGLRLDSGGDVINTTITRNRLLVLPDDWPTKKPVGASVIAVDEISGWGGGIDNRGGGDVVIVNSTIVGNHALKGGGGLAAGQGYAPISEQAALGKMTLRNTIVANNVSKAGPANCHVKDQVIESLGNNLSSDDSCFLSVAKLDKPKTDPLLGPLGHFGGPTRTIMLKPGSPAIDAGGAKDCPKTDGRGVARPQGKACDIGAYERRVKSRRG